MLWASDTAGVCHRQLIQNPGHTGCARQSRLPEKRSMESLVSGFPWPAADARKHGRAATVAVGEMAGVCGPLGERLRAACMQDTPCAGCWELMLSAGLNVASRCSGAPGAFHPRHDIARRGTKTARRGLRCSHCRVKQLQPHAHRTSVLRGLIAGSLRSRYRTLRLVHRLVAILV